MTPKLTFYTTEGCHLCDMALDNIRTAQNTVSFELETIDIQEEYETFEKYKDDIPVVLVNGIEIGRHHISAELITEIIKELSINA